MSVRPDRTLSTPKTADNLNTMSIQTQTSRDLRALRPALQHCLSWLAATPLAVGLCLATAPKAQAASFTDPNDISNPFLYSNWDLVSGGNSSSASVTQPDDTSILFYSSGAGTDTFTSGRASQSYNINFNYNFAAESGDGFTSAIAYYQICGDSTCSEILSNGNFGAGGGESVTLASNQYLRFGIDNNDTAGDLTISDFNATEVPAEGVPAPLSALGAGAAFGWIRRRRAQLKAHQSFHL